MSSALVEFLRSAVLSLHILGWAMLYALALGGVAGVLLWAMLGFLRQRSAWARYALCCGAMVLLAGIPLRAWVSIRSAYAGHEEKAVQYAVEIMSTQAPEPLGALPGGWTAADLSAAIENRHDHEIHSWIAGGPALWLGSVLAFCASAWIVGASRRLRRLDVGLRAVRRLASYDVRSVSERWERILREVQGRIGVRHPVQLGVSPHIDGPVLVGWWRPKILLPPGPHDRLSDVEAEAVLAHELAHVRRGDYAVNLIQSLAEALLFFHPAMWWLGDRMRDEREYSSDDLARTSIRGSLRDYLRALATLESLRGVPVPDPAVAADGRSLVRRARRLVELAKRPRLPRLDVDVVLVVFCLIALWAPVVHWTRTAREASIAVMKHEMRLPRDYGRIAEEAGLRSGAHGRGEPGMTFRDSDTDLEPAHRNRGPEGAP